MSGESRQHEDVADAPDVADTPNPRSPASRRIAIAIIVLVIALPVMAILSTAIFGGDWLDDPPATVPAGSGGGIGG